MLGTSACTKGKLYSIQFSKMIKKKIDNNFVNIVKTEEIDNKKNKWEIGKLKHAKQLCKNCSDHSNERMMMKSQYISCNLYIFAQINNFLRIYCNLPKLI